MQSDAQIKPLLHLDQRLLRVVVYETAHEANIRQGTRLAACACVREAHGVGVEQHHLNIRAECRQCKPKMTASTAEIHCSLAGAE
jgi:hypothetical protein